MHCMLTYLFYSPSKPNSPEKEFISVEMLRQNNGNELIILHNLRNEFRGLL